MVQIKLDNIHATDVTGAAISGVGISQARLKKSIVRTLENCGLCSVATVTPSNRAHVCHLYFCYSDDLELYFLSHPLSLHCRCLKENSSCAITIYSSGQLWGGRDQGLQLFGTCAEAKAAQAKKAERCYGERFSSYWSWKANWKKDDPARDYRFYQFTTKSLKVLDEKEFGAGPGGIFVRASVKRPKL